MGTVEERKRNDELVDKLVEMASNGNGDAKRYLSLFAYTVRVFDDLIDKDYPVTDKQICRSFFILMAELWLNPFFIRNHKILISLHIVAVNAFLDSNIWMEDDEVLKRIYAHVMKDFVNEILVMVSFLTGGYKNMRRFSLEMRDLCKEDIEEDTGIDIKEVNNG